MRFGEIIRPHIQAADADGRHLAASPIRIDIRIAVRGIALVVGFERIGTIFPVERDRAVDIHQQIRRIADLHEIATSSAINCRRNTLGNITYCEYVAASSQLDVYFFNGGILDTAARPHGQAGDGVVIEQAVICCRPCENIETVFVPAISGRISCD